MEWRDVLTALKNKGYNAKFNDARNQIIIGSWRNNYRFNICRNVVTKRLCLEYTPSSQFLFGFWVSSFIIIFNSSSFRGLSDTLSLSFYAFMFLSILYIRYLGKKERSTKQDLDALLFELNLDEYKANQTLTDA
ncbi:hypothetical protein AB8616_21620 [Marinomonas sp. RS-M-Aa-14]|uniref:hypothetical protein n=1 Tax=Marinomonas sp. RS-M-Aa-14 TaxID=3241169 RepID=UPI00390C5C36